MHQKTVSPKEPNKVPVQVSANVYNAKHAPKKPEISCHFKALHNFLPNLSASRPRNVISLHLVTCLSFVISVPSVTSLLSAISSLPTVVSRPRMRQKDKLRIVSIARYCYALSC